MSIILITGKLWDISNNPLSAIPLHLDLCREQLLEAAATWWSQFKLSYLHNFEYLHQTKNYLICITVNTVIRAKLCSISAINRPYHYNWFCDSNCNTFEDIQLLNFQIPLICINFNYGTLTTCSLEAQPLQTYIYQLKSTFYVH